MKDTRALRTAIQAIGVYFLCQGVWHGMSAVVRLVTVHYAQRDQFGAPISATNELFFALLPYLTYAAQYLVLAWVLLVKTDWSVRTVVRFSKPRPAESGTDSEP